MIPREGGHSIYLAGIYHEVLHEETGEITTTFTIKTTPRSKVTEEAMHMRSPLTIPPDLVEHYLDDRLQEKDLAALYHAPMSQGMICYEIDLLLAKRSPASDVQPDDPSLIAPLSEAN